MKTNPPTLTGSPGAGTPELLKVLVVDDHELNREVLTDFLSNSGCTVHAVADGPTALLELSRLRPDVVLMDVQMPGMDGLEVTRRIRLLGDPELAQTPVLGLTALGMPGDRERSLAAGMNDYRVKPFSLKSLLELLPTLVRPKGPAGTGNHPSS